MSNIEKAFFCMKPGEPVRADTIIQRTGLTRADVGPILSKLHARGQIVKIDRGAYTLASTAPLLPSQVAELRAEQKRLREERIRRLRNAAQARYVAKRQEKRRVEKEREEDARESVYRTGGTVASAIANRSALSMAWAG